MRILITGATGFIGRSVSLRLQRDGHSLVAWVRNPAAARAALGPDIDLIHTGDRAALIRETAAAHAVINLAGAPILDARWSKRRRSVLWQSRVGVTRQLVDAIRAAEQRPAVLISASAVGYYGDRGDQCLDETAAAGDDFAAQLCAAWEREADRATGLGVRVVSPRIGVVLGQEGMLAKILPMFRAGLGGRLGNGRQYLPWIHIDDVVEVVCSALTDQRYTGAINLVSPKPARYSQLVDELGELLGRPTRLRTPALLLHAVLGARARLLLGSQRATPGRLRELGYEFRFSELQPALSDCCAADDITVRRASTWPGVDYLMARKPRYVLEQELFVRAPIDDVFRFFSDARNLSLLTPPELSFEIRTPEVNMGVGARIDYRIRLGPVPMAWTSSIEAWQPGRRFVDAQRRGPYRSWWHEHSFEARDDGTVVRDRVYYAPPFGALGRLANRLLVAPKLRRIFSFRRAAVARRFGTAPAAAARPRAA